MHKEAYEITNYLATQCGKRIAGTENLNKASRYIASKFDEYGVENEFHKFTIPVCEIEYSRLEVTVDGNKKVIEHKPSLFSKSTEKGGISLPLVFCGNGSIAELDAKDVKGKAVLIFRDSYIEYPDLLMYKRLYEYGVKAVFFTSSDGHRGIPYVYSNYEFLNEEYTIPTAIISFDDANILARHDDVIIDYEVKFNINEAETQNTIGIIHGTNPEAGNVLVCAHLDSAYGSVGATDDAGGVGVVMMMAKHYAELRDRGQQPERTIRFIAWSGHECGLHGSKNFARDYHEVLDEMKFVFNYDIIGNTLSSPQIWAGCDKDVERKINDIVESMNYEWFVDVGPWVVDTVSFAHKGIQHLTFSAGIDAINHTELDNMDYVSEEGFVLPIAFSKAVIDWIAGKEEIKQGYPESLNEAIKFYASKYGWGLF